MTRSPAASWTDTLQALPSPSHSNPPGASARTRSLAPVVSPDQSAREPDRGTGPADELVYDPFDPATRRDPYPIYARLRAEAPLYRTPLGALAVARHDDVRGILREPGDFSSSPFIDLISRADDLAVEQGTATADELGTPHEILIGADPPRHGRLRAMVNRGFTPNRIATLAPRVRDIARDLFDEFRDEQACDFVADFASPLAVTVIAELLGIDPERHLDFRRWTNAMILTMTGNPVGEERATCSRALDELGEALDELVALRRVRPRADLVSALVHAASDPEVMDLEEVRSFVMLLLVAGNETTANLLGNAMRLLCERPDLAAVLERAPERIPAFVEEMLRFDSPVQLTLRRATRDVEVAGEPVSEGETLLLLLGSANRDETAFARPDEFDLRRFDGGRATASHLGFGFGQHYCLGSALARLEATAALETVLCGATGFRLREQPVEYTNSFLVRGPSRLRIGFGPVDASVANRPWTAR